METQKLTIDFLQEILQNRTEKTSLDWLAQQAQKIQSLGSSTSFFLAFSQASRYFKKSPLNLSLEQKQAASALIPGFDPSHWDLLQTARTSLLLHFPQEKTSWFKAINQLFETADMHEHQALFAALPLLPFQEDLIPRAIDGLRTNISSVFDSIALNNPFPAQYFPEANWNQMVLKAVFMQRPLFRIDRFEDRRNLSLATIASDFAHERWAAGRPVMAEIWRLVVPFFDKNFLQDIQKVIASGDLLQIQAAVLACSESDFAPAQALAASHPEILSETQTGKINWQRIGIEFQTRV
jgi:hypothetical protein